MKMSDYIPEYKEATGKPVSAAVVCFAEAMDLACEKAEQMGKQHASNGGPAYSKAVFRKWGAKEIGEDMRLADTVADFVYAAYMNGYSTGEASE